MMVYNGAIYPVPQAILLAGLYAIACAVAMRSWRPVGLTIARWALRVRVLRAAPLPIVDMLRRFPRLVDSTETMDLAAFVGIFTAKTGDPRPGVGPWGWHEYGDYVGWIPFALMLVAPFVARRARERGMASRASSSIVLGFGRFHH